MIAQVYSLLGQTESKKNLFSGGGKHKSLTCAGDVDQCKNVHHPLSTVPVAIVNNLEVFKTNHLALL